MRSGEECKLADDRGVTYDRRQGEGFARFLRTIPNYPLRVYRNFYSVQYSRILAARNAFDYVRKELARFAVDAIVRCYFELRTRSF
jgi:hypothetical protein